MKKLFVFLTFGLFAGLLLTSCAKDAEVMTGTINGYVSDYTNANTPIAGVTVTINSKGLTKTTGSDGRFEFMNLEPGTYSLSFTANNYQPTTKQVTVYAGQIATCDAQLEKARALIDISPVNLTFGKSVDQASFTITNNGNNQFTYSLSNYPDYVEVSPAAGTVAAKGQQVVSVRIINRSAINEQKNGQLIVNVGNDSYTVSFSVEAYHGETVNVDVSPQTLTFDKNTEQLTFAITNNSSRSVDFNISNNLDILTITPESGTIAANAKNTITVGVTDRKAVTENRTGQITIDIEGNTFVVAVGVDKYEEGGNPDDNSSGDISTTRGLLAYYTFDNDNANNAYRDNDHGFIIDNATYITDTPNGKGKAISLERGNFVNIPSNMLDEKNSFSICLWLKDFGSGFLFKTDYQWGYEVGGPPTLWINDEGKLDVVYSKYATAHAKISMQTYQSSGWHMLTVTFDGTSEIIVVYIDGKKVDSIGTGYIKSEGESMQIGGTDPMKSDNIRIHSVVLEEKEVAEIYAAESK